MNHVQALIAFESAMAKARKTKSIDAALGIIEVWARAELRDRRVKVDDGIIGRVVTMDDKGEAVSAIADELGLSTATVRRILRGSGRYKKARARG
jgi:DNA invertase Pin-like site-specific DNA recombinase